VQHAVLRSLYASRAGRRVIESSIGGRLQRALPLRLAIALQFHHHMGYFPNLRNPKTLSEKIQYRKLHDRDPRMPPLVDKVAAKLIVAGILGPEWVIPTLWSGADPAAMPLESLAPPYIVKASHASGCNYVVLDADAVDPARIRAEATRWLALDYGRRYHEWAYTRVPRRLLIEPYIGRGAAYPNDMRFSVFHGRVQHISVTVGRGTPEYFIFVVDPEWNWMPVSIAMQGRAERRDVPPPASLAAMRAAAVQLAAPFGYARVDLYEVDQRPLFGELTLYPNAGYTAYHPPAYERLLGDLWRL
jgi:hypothetical protein